MASIAEILLQQGREAADARRNRGALWGSLVQRAGQIPQQVEADTRAQQDRAAAQQIQQQQSTLNEQRIAAGGREADAAAAGQRRTAQLAQVWGAGVYDAPSGRIDLAKVQQVATEIGAPDLVPVFAEIDQQGHAAELDRLMKESGLAKDRAAMQRQAQEDRAKANQRGVRQMIGASVAARGGQPLDDATRQSLQGMAFQEGIDTKDLIPDAKPETRSLEVQLAEAIKRNDRPGMNAIRQAMKEDAAAKRASDAGPRDPLETTTTWAIDPRDGQAKPMTLAEARRIGAGQPPTADMRNKEAGKRTAGRAVTAVRTLGAGIINKVGPAQRAQAIKRGAEAIFGNDPEFRTYQDSRMALAGTLAVEQQGARVSDADVKALWLPMVPDAYRDTAESYTLKWDLIDAMRGVEGGGPRASQPAPVTGGTVRMRAPDGRELAVPAADVPRMKSLGAVEF